MTRDDANYNTYLADYQELEQEMGPLPESGEIKVYRMLVHKMRADEKYTLSVDFTHLSMFPMPDNFDIADQLLCYFQIHYPLLLQGMFEFV